MTSSVRKILYSSDKIPQINSPSSNLLPPKTPKLIQSSAQSYPNSLPNSQTQPHPPPCPPHTPTQTAPASRSSNSYTSPWNKPSAKLHRRHNKQLLPVTHTPTPRIRIPAQNHPLATPPRKRRVKREGPNVARGECGHFVSPGGREGCETEAPGHRFVGRGAGGEQGCWVGEWFQEDELDVLVSGFRWAGWGGLPLC